MGKIWSLRIPSPYYMKDGHIWALLDGEDVVDVEKLAFYIELLLKFDWERSKSEVRFRPIKAINQVMQCLFIFFIYLLYLC